MSIGRRVCYSICQYMKQKTTTKKQPAEVINHLRLTEKYQTIKLGIDWQLGANCAKSFVTREGG